MIKGKIIEPGEASELKTKQNNKKISWLSLQCSGSSQIPSQDSLDDPHWFLSLYNFVWNHGSTKLYIYDTESQIEEVKILDAELILNGFTVVTQLPNGELFCYGGYSSVKALIIDRSYRVRMLPWGTPCVNSSALYFDNNIYCFGGKNLAKSRDLPLSRKFDLKNNRWINLHRLPWAESRCHSVIFNGNILVSGWDCLNLWLYSIEIDSFSTIPYDFASSTIKFLVNVERLYLIEWGGNNKLIYESEDEYNWKPISKAPCFSSDNPSYCLYNNEKIYISAGGAYYQFDLKTKAAFKIIKPL